jgi:UDP-N-acetylglucosamine 3-dehydrogenase
VIDVAILGAGFMGTTHAAGWKALGPRARVRWVSSRSGQKAARVAASVGAQPTTDLFAPITDPAVQAVDICLPTFLHREACERAFAAGKHVLLEKPLALTREDADAILTIAARSGRVFVVGLVLRFFSEYVEIERRVRSRALGRPLAVSTYRLSPPPDWNDWMRDPARSGGPAVDLLIHDFDQMNWLLGRPRQVVARSAAAAGGGPGHIQALLEYDGATALAEGSLMMPRSYPFSAGIRVLCEKGVLEHGFRAAPAEGGGNIGGNVTRFLRLHPSAGGSETLPAETSDPWAAEIAYFAECVVEARSPLCGTGEQARDALLVSLAVNRSLRSSRPELVV